MLDREKQLCWKGRSNYVRQGEAIVLDREKHLFWGQGEAIMLDREKQLCWTGRINCVALTFVQYG